MHSLAVTEKRGAFKVWTVLLAILAFFAVAARTFLCVRAADLVHAFRERPAPRGIHPAVLAIVIGGSLALFAWRARRSDWASASNWCRARPCC